MSNSKPEMIDKQLYEDICYGTNLISGEEYKQTSSIISQLAADMVVKTLGPYGQTTIIDDASFTHPTKDGWSVLKKLQFSDPVYNSIYNVLKQISFDLVERVGDGTTSSIIGANYFMKRLYAATDGNKFRQTDFLKSLNEAVKNITEAILTSQDIHHIDTDGDFEDIYRVAFISSNGDEVLSRAIQDIYKQSKNPNIYVNMDVSDSLSYEIQSGYKLDCLPFQQRAYVNDENGAYMVTEETLVFIFDHNVTYREHSKIISGLSRFAGAKNKSMLVMAPYFDDIIMTIFKSTIDTYLQKGQVPNLMVVQVGNADGPSQNYLSDFAVLTNAQIFEYGMVRALNTFMFNIEHPEDGKKIEDDLLNIEGYDFKSTDECYERVVGHIGECDIHPRYLILRNYENIAQVARYTPLMKEVEETYLKEKERANKSSTNLLKDYMQAYQRFIRLTGHMGIIKVGGRSDLEKKCLFDSVEDSVLACRSAYENGYIRGLNMLTLTTIKELIDTEKSKEVVNTDLALTYQIFYNVFRDMALTVLRNKYDDDDERTVLYHDELSAGVVSSKTVKNEDIVDYCIDHKCGYDLVAEKIMSDEACTVINSVSTDIEIIKGITSVLSIMMTSNQFLTSNRTYDRKLSRRQVLDNRIEEDTERFGAIASAVSTALAANPIPFVIQPK